ncbi:hypothetical protein [Lentilactobacillus senioris]|uniref:hypothetical protein n=1 Tax=Lentilactobacillus senioris TaxID=931534 RepID=UPI000AF7B163|nr:hypothetical protein [Lentilactobacillus senioris]
MQSQMYAYFHFINAREAIEYYQEVFGATNVFRVSPDEQQAKVLHLPENANLDNITMNGGFDVLGSHFVCADSFSGALRLVTKFPLCWIWMLTMKRVLKRRLNFMTALKLVDWFKLLCHILINSGGVVS